MKSQNKFAWWAHKQTSLEVDHSLYEIWRLLVGPSRLLVLPAKACLVVDGQPKTEYGLQLLDCNRGTNDVENDHKRYVTTFFGTWHWYSNERLPSLAEGTDTISECRTIPIWLSQLERNMIPWRVDLLQILVQKKSWPGCSIILGKCKLISVHLRA
jgi:hypothetical protein